MQPAQSFSDNTTRHRKITTPHKSRTDLLLLATNLFCASNSHDRHSVEQYKEAFYLLISDAEFSTKQIAARTLSNCEAAPRSVVLYFALEQIEIAHPILARSPVIGQLDMLRVIEMKGLEHSSIIATRPDIGPSVVKKLRDIEDSKISDVLANNHALVDNAAAPSADELFSNILSRRADERSQSTSSISETQKQSDALSISNEKETSKSSSSEQPSTAAEAEAKKTPEQALIAAAARGGRLNGVSETPNSIPALDFDFGEAMERASKTHSHQAMAALMQKKFAVSFDTAHQVLGDKSGDTLAVMLRAANVDAAQANRIQLLTHPTIGLSVHNAMRAVRFYERLQIESCQTAVDQWPKATDNLPKHQPYLEDSEPARHRQTSTRQTVPDETPRRQVQIAG